MHSAVHHDGTTSSQGTNRLVYITAAMTACKMAAMAPQRVASAMLLGCTVTGWDMMLSLFSRPVRLMQVRDQP